MEGQVSKMKILRLPRTKFISRKPVGVIGLNRAIFPESGQVAVPDSEFCQLEQVAVNSILSNHCLGGPHQSITLFRVGRHIQRFNDRVEARF